MKAQTFIANILDHSGKQIGFERFSCKRADTVKRQMLQLFDNSFYRSCFRDAWTVQVHATPDGYHEKNDPELIFSV